MTRARPTPRGFTLLEVLVAFVIAAIAIAVLIRGGVDGLRGVQTAGRYEEATTLARSHLAGASLDPRPGTGQGEDGHGFHWRSEVRQIGSAVVHSGPADDGDEAPKPTVRLFAITVWISWDEAGRTRELRLDTERVAPGPPTAGG